MNNNEFNYVSELQPGTTLNNGKYTVEKKIGAGGFGITYKAVQGGLGRSVCIKEYFPAGRCMRNTLARTVHLQDMTEEMFEKYRLAFVREAQTLAQLRHQGIVEVIDVFDENNTSYMVMPFIEGRSLQSIVEQNGPLSYPEAVNYIAQVCNAVDYIHQRNILHRDIKPDNIMITADYKAILIDFGSAREFEQDKTQSHTSLLTHGYAPIEQYSKTSRKGSYTDIYAIGATLYYILTGQVPTEAAVRFTEDMPEPKQLNPSIPDEANRTIMKAMELKGENRHQTIQEFLSDLRNTGTAQEQTTVNDNANTAYQQVNETLNATSTIAGNNNNSTVGNSNTTHRGSYAEEQERRRLARQMKPQDNMDDMERRKLERLEKQQERAAQAQPVVEKKRHGFVSFWLGLMYGIYILSLISSVISLFSTIGYLDPLLVIFEVVSIAIVFVNIMAVRYLFSWQKKGFWIILVNAVLIFLINIFITGTMYYYDYYGSFMWLMMFAPLIGVAILWAVLQIKKNGVSCWSQLE